MRPDHSILSLLSLLSHVQRLAVLRDGPFYLYDESGIRASCALFRRIAYAPAAVHFATMANANPTFLRLVREEGLSVFVNSPGHLDLALEAGFRPDQVVFAASALPASLMSRLGELGVHVNLDSLGQVRLWRERCPGRPFGLRCNVGASAGLGTGRGVFVGARSRLGLTPRELRCLRGAPDVRGLHLYVGTDLMEISLFESGYARLGALVKHFPELEYLDLGGGFGVPREGGAPFDVPAYGEMVTAFMEACSASAGRRLRLVLEPGRVVGATAGIFVCRVTDVKHRAGKQLVGVDASSAQFPRPLFYPETARHPAWILRAGACVEGPARLSMVYGCSTYSRDYLVRNQALPEAREGDLVCLGQAGSYCASSHTRFLGFEPAPEYFA